MIVVDHNLLPLWSICVEFLLGQFYASGKRGKVLFRSFWDISWGIFVWAILYQSGIDGTQLGSALDLPPHSKWISPCSPPARGGQQAICAPVWACAGWPAYGTVWALYGIVWTWYGTVWPLYGIVGHRMAPYARHAFLGHRWHGGQSWGAAGYANPGMPSPDYGDLKLARVSLLVVWHNLARLIIMQKSRITVNRFQVGRGRRIWLEILDATNFPGMQWQ